MTIEARAPADVGHRPLVPCAAPAPQRMSGADWVWIGLFTAGAGFEAYALRYGRHDDTLSESTRRWFRVRHPAGRAAFVVGWLAFTAWWLRHILHGGPKP